MDITKRSRIAVFQNSEVVTRFYFFALSPSTTPVKATGKSMERKKNTSLLQACPAGEILIIHEQTHLHSPTGKTIMLTEMLTEQQAENAYLGQFIPLQ
jgi:hypothetical protein